MNMCKYCHDNKMTITEYENFATNINKLAIEIKSKLYYQNGIYFPVDEIIPYNTNSTIKDFIIQELKKLGLEFYDNNELYRVTDWVDLTTLNRLLSQERSTSNTTI